MLGDFYKVVQKQKTKQGFDAWVALNREHLIYKVHFPENPITPGVCILQICQELVEQHCGNPMRMTTAKNVKFLNVLSPLEFPEIIFSMTCEGEEDEVKVSVVIHDGEKSFAKISTTYVINN